MAFTKSKSIFDVLLEESALIPKGKALDLGCGKGFDVCTFAEKGFIVDAVDKDQVLLDQIKSKRADINLIKSSIEDFVIQRGSYNLITASFSLQFLSKDKAQIVITNMIEGLVENGVCIFNVIGNRDEWANNGTWSTWGKEELISFLGRLGAKLRNFNEKEGLGDTRVKGLKYWHVYEVVLVKTP